jgi:hypothetical protein
MSVSDASGVKSAYNDQELGGTAMPWSPVSKETLERILTEEIAALTPEATKAYQNYAVAPYEQRCSRTADYGIERVFVVARKGNHLLFFDDVEEEFGVGVPDSDAILRDLGTFDSLIAALLALDRIETIP